MTEGAELAVAADPAGDGDYASRGAYKLLGALDAFAGLDVAGRECLDAGASTGGFTDVLLRRGARHVVAMDVGHDQLVERLRADPRVDVREGVNVRGLVAGDLEPPPTLVVADLSFISLTLVLPALVAVAAPRAELVVMVKPQFELGRERLGSSGVVRSAEQRVETVLVVARCALDLGLAVAGVVQSPLPGPSGNVEYFLRLRRDADGAPVPSVQLEDLVRSVVQGGGVQGSLVQGGDVPDGAAGGEQR
ncbi:MAG TPA: TlyA family RNA methyltransferase [Cellulomonas sp.]